MAQNPGNVFLMGIWPGLYTKVLKSHTHKNKAKKGNDVQLQVLPYIQHHKHINTYINKYEQHSWWH